MPGGEDWAELGAELSRRERRAMEAERAAARPLPRDPDGERGRQQLCRHRDGVQRFGLFVRLDETMAEGLVPIGRLGEEYFHHDAGRHALRGERSGTVFALGDRLRVELTEVDLAAGQLTFRPLEHTPGPAGQGGRRSAWRAAPADAAAAPPASLSARRTAGPRLTAPGPLLCSTRAAPGADGGVASWRNRAPC